MLPLVTGTILSKDIVQLHQIIKKEEPVLYSDALNEIHRYLSIALGFRNCLKTNIIYNSNFTL